ncbi:MAG: FtsB family cell division protein [Marinifilaceae bacterium]
MVSVEEQDNTPRYSYRKFVNAYTVLTVMFAIYMCFIADNSGWEIYKLNQQIKKLREEKNYYENKIEKDQKSKDELFSSKEKLEKFAREHYYMKESNEDIYIIIRK